MEKRLTCGFTKQNLDLITETTMGSSKFNGLIAGAELKILKLGQRLAPLEIKDQIAWLSSKTASGSSTKGDLT